MVSIKYKWLDLLWKCYHHGKDVKKDDSEIRELMGNYVFLDSPQHTGFNNFEIGPELFLKMLKKGAYDIEGYPIKGEALYDYVNSLNSDDHIFCSDPEERMALGLDPENLPFVYTYPERLIHTMYFTDCDDDYNIFDIDYINQIDTIVNRLSDNNGSNRAVATLYNPGVDRFRDDIPCLNWLQATIRDNKLTLHVMFRSNDLFQAWPSNMYLITYLGLVISERVGCEFCGIYYHSSSLHIYKTNIDEVEDVIHEYREP